MAKEKKSEGGKGKKKHLKAITTHKADDGSFIHEHKYQDEDGNESSSYGGVSSDLADLQQHMADHLGPDAEQAQPDQQGGDGADAGAAPAAGTAAPPAQAQ